MVPVNATQAQLVDSDLRSELDSYVGTTDDDHDNGAGQQGSPAPDQRASLSESDARVPTLSMPFEILHPILEYAILPNVLLDPSFCRGPYSAWSQTLRQIKAFTLVCRMWRNVGYDLLYRNVVVRHIGQIPALLRSLQGNSSLRPMVRSLQIISFISPKHNAIFEYGLTRILSLCENAKCLSLRHETEDVFHDFPTIPCFILSSIAELDIGPGHYLPSAVSSLVQCTHLVILTISFGRFIGTDDIPSPEFGSLEELHCIDVSRSPAVRNLFVLMAKRWSLPCLKRLTLHCRGPEDYVAQSEPFLRVHGKKLNFLSILGTSKPSMTALGILQNVLHLCPSLHHLVLNLPDLYPELSHPEVRYIDIWTYPEFDWTFREVSEQFPALKCGRLLSIVAHTESCLHLPIDLLQLGPSLGRWWTYTGLESQLDSNPRAIDKVVKCYYNTVENQDSGCSFREQLQRRQFFCDLPFLVPLDKFGPDSDSEDGSYAPASTPSDFSDEFDSTDEGSSRSSSSPSSPSAQLQTVLEEFENALAFEEARLAEMDSLGICCDTAEVLFERDDR